MITTQIPRELETFPNFADLLPKPNDLITSESGMLGISRQVPIHPYDYMNKGIGEYERYVVQQWERMYADLMYEVGKRLIGNREHHVIRLIDRVWQNGMWDFLKMELYAEITVVPYKEFVIPEFVYDTHMVPYEWKCGSCGSINPIEARYCGEVGEHPYGCGKPRARLAQEIYAEARC